MIHGEIKAFALDPATALAEETLTELMLHYPEASSR